MDKEQCEVCGAPIGVDFSNLVFSNGTVMYCSCGEKMVFSSMQLLGYLGDAVVHDVHGHVFKTHPYQCMGCRHIFNTSHQKCIPMSVGGHMWELSVRKG